MDIKIANRYKLGRKLGSGSFGDIYLATDLTTNEEVAVKLEHTKAQTDNISKSLKSTIIFLLLLDNISLLVECWLPTADEAPATARGVQILQGECRASFFQLVTWSLQMRHSGLTKEEITLDKTKSRITDDEVDKIFWPCCHR